MPREAIDPLVDDVAAAFPSIPGVFGPEPEAGSFAAAWSARTGARARVGMRQGIYRLERVVVPDTMPAGHLRAALPQDFDLAVEWAAHFVRETGIDDRQLEKSIGTRITAGTLWLWDDERPRSMAAEGGRTPNGSRINWVFTPEEWRGRGYASACVARLSERILASGKRFCFLYTDLSNPTSNALYQRIGYQRVCDVVEYRFIEPTQRASAQPRSLRT
jgi:predicted GNAT family acetyltransferase